MMVGQDSPRRPAVIHNRRCYCANVAVHGHSAKEG
jgi:hypothetical protein